MHCEVSRDQALILKVNFIGDAAAADDGGPRREFFSLLTKGIFLCSGLSSGWPFNDVMQTNIQALGANTYYAIGKMLCVCFVQGGQPPSCFSRAVADFLVHGKVTSPACIEDIPDYDIQQLVVRYVITESTGTRIQS